MTPRDLHGGLSAQERAEIDSLMRKFAALPVANRRRVAARLLLLAASMKLQDEAAIIHRPPAPAVVSVN